MALTSSWFRSGEPESRSLLDWIGGLMALVGLVALTTSVVFAILAFPLARDAVQAAYQEIFAPTPGRTLDALTGGTPPLGALLLALEALCLGLLLSALMRAFARRPRGPVMMASLSSMFSPRTLARPDRLAPNLLLAGLVAAFCGWALGMAGATGVSHLFLDGFDAQLAALMPPQADSSSRVSLWLCLLLTFYAGGIMLGGAAGLCLGLLLGALQGYFRAGLTGKLFRFVGTQASDDWLALVVRAAGRGTLHGAFIGSTVGLLSGVCSLWVGL